MPPSTVTITPPAGVFRNGTRYQAKGRWYDANLVRFLEDSVRPIGGWQVIEGTATTYILDDFNDTDETELTSHTADIPAAVWSKHLTSGAGPNAKIQNDGTLSTLETSSAGTARATLWPSANVTTINSTNDGDWYIDFQSDLWDLSSNGPRFAIVARANNSLTAMATDGDGVYVELTSELSSPGNEMTIITGNWDAGSQTNKIDHGLPGGIFDLDSQNDPFPAAGVRLGMTIDDEGVQPWIEDYGGGNRILVGNKNTGVDLFQDANHQRYAFTFIGGANASIRVQINQLAFVDTDIKGKVRALLGWKDNANAATILAIGSNRGIWTFTQGSTTDRTPVGFTEGNEDATITVGNYGAGDYGAFNYGEGDPAQASLTEADSWQLDTFGDFLVGVATSDNTLYYYDPAGVPAVMSAMTDAPTADALVVTSERFVVALGAGGDPRKVQWATQEGGIQTSGDWTAASSNSAGDFILAGVGSIQCGRRGKNETLIFTDEDLWAMQFIGGTLVFRFRQLGAKCGIISRHAVAVVDGRAIWMGQRGFFIYDGFVRSLDSSVSDYVFKDFNRTQRSKCWAMVQGNFGEVWFFYPSGESEEPDRYVIYNYREDTWNLGTLSRTAGIDRGAFEYPILAGPLPLRIYDHERGTERDNVAPYLESGPIEIAQGERVLQVQDMIPDENTIVGEELGSLIAKLHIAYHPTGTETELGSFTLANPTSMRGQGRQVRLRVEETSAGDWRLGNVRLQGVPGGRR